LSLLGSEAASSLPLLLHKYLLSYTPFPTYHQVMTTSTTTFSQNERVLCYHGPLIYEAKILKIENWDETTSKSGTLGPHFFVHYKGWKQTSVFSFLARYHVVCTRRPVRWDEWVPATRLLKYNETNIGLAKTLKDASSASTSKANKSDV
jgi:mortality factor 4-like protein 1